MIPARPLVERVAPWGAVLSSDYFGSSVERTAKLHPPALSRVSMLTVAIVRVLAVLGGPIVEREVGMTSDDWFDALY
jgi:hypothetical protein